MRGRTAAGWFGLRRAGRGSGCQPPRHCRWRGPRGCRSRPWSSRQAPHSLPGQRESARTPLAAISPSWKPARSSSWRVLPGAGTSPSPVLWIASLGRPRRSRYNLASVPRSPASSCWQWSKNVCSSSARRSRGCGRSSGEGSTPARSAISFTARTKSSASRDGAAVHVRRPQHRLAAVDEKAPGRDRPVRDDAFGADAEQGVRVLLVGRHPAAGVAAPAELRESPVEALQQGRQHRLGVEVARAHGLLAVLDRQYPSSLEKAVEGGGRDLALVQAELRRSDPEPVEQRGQEAWPRTAPATRGRRVGRRLAGAAGREAHHTASELLATLSRFV